MPDDFTPHTPPPPARIGQLRIELIYSAEGYPTSEYPERQEVAYTAVLLDAAGRPAYHAAGSLLRFLTPAQQAQALDLLDAMLAKAQRLIP
jgi:hypothetical protein